MDLLYKLMHQLIQVILGALIDRNGYLIGITNLIETTSGGSQGLNFAIPVDEVLKIYDEIIN